MRPSIKIGLALILIGALGSYFSKKKTFGKEMSPWGHCLTFGIGMLLAGLP